MKILHIEETICLRQLIAADAADIFEAIDTQRTHLGRWLPFVESTRRIEDSVEFVSRTLAADPYEYTFTLRCGDRFAGLIGFKSTAPASRTTEIGYWMREEFQGKGMMTAAVQALCAFARNELGMQRVEIKCATGNAPSNRIPQRLGFHIDRIEQNSEILTGGNPVDANVWVADLTTTPL